MIKKLIIFTFLLMFGGIVWGQTHSNTCAGLGAGNILTIGGSCGSGTLTNNNNTGPAYTCGGTLRKHGYYTFTTGASAQTLTITGMSADRNLALQVYTGGCASITEIACANSNTNNNSAQTEQITFNALASTTYIIKVLNVGNNNDMVLNSLCITVASNDVCAAATSLTVNGSCINTAGNTTGATQSLAGCSGTADDDVWYSFVAPASGLVTVTVTPGASFNAVYELFSGSCASLTSVGCVNNGNAGGVETNSFSGLTSGATYFVRVYHRGAGSSVTPTFNICVFAPTPLANDNCGGAVVLTPNVSCVTTAGSTANASQSQAGCTGNADDDVWFSFTAAATNQLVQVDGATSFDAVVQVFSGACGGLVSLQCADASVADGIEGVNLTGLTVGVVYFVRVYHNGAGSSTTPTFTICVTTPPANDNACGAFNIPMNNCGSPLAGTSLNASQSLAGCAGTADDDVWFSFTASAGGYAQLTAISTAGYDAVVQVFSGACGSLASLSCVNATGAGASEVVTLTGLITGATYFVRVYNSGAGSGTNTFTLCVTDVPPACSVDFAFGATPLGGSTQTSTTCGAVNNLTSANVVNFCGASYYFDGEDMLYSFIAPISGTTTLALTSSGSYTSLNVFDDCPTSGGSCIGSSQSSTGPKNVTLCVTAGVTYYVIVDSWPAPTCNPFTLTIPYPTGGISAATNDLPCSATSMVLGVPSAGNNACTGAATEPSLPTCWSSGTRNTVWYTVVAPASGQLKIRTMPTNTGSPLQNTQIAVYGGTCSALSLVACNDNAPACGSYTQYFSDLTVTGLTAGLTYFIVVDGNTNSVGTFEILAIDGNTSYSPVPGQDCFPALPVCNNTMTTGNPGYQAIGASCDYTGLGNCTSGEANSVWYSFSLIADGDVLFNIIPNDYGATNPITGVVNPGYTGPGDETDYDWVLWKVGGTGSTSCAAILSSGGDGESACNFSFLGVTGASIDGNAASAGYPAGFDAAYEVGPAGLNGDTYMLVVQNYSNSTSGFSLVFPPTTPINYTPSSTLYWSGGANTSAWETSSNWGGCGTPTCGISAVIMSSSSFQPSLTNTVASTYNVNNLTINSGASLTIQSGVTLNICGDFTNNGNLICQSGSIVNFVGSGIQNLTGSFVGADAFNHFTVTKTTGSVVLGNNITVNGDLTTSNNTSILNSNSKYIRLGRHFINNNGNTTFTNTGTTGTLDFIGSGLQNFNQGASQLDLNNVVLNNTSGLGTGVTLLTNLFIKAATGTLTLNTGTITTNAFRVDIANTAIGSATAGNTSSFVNGNLRRYLLGSGTYNWPLGSVAKGYQRALTTFASNANPYVDARFDSWPGGLPLQGGSDCGTTFSMDAMDNGYWTLTGTGAAATYNMSLFPLNVTNAATGWTIMKHASYALAGWTLNGVCTASTVTQINRNNMTNFSVFGIAQSPTPLPIELLYFDGEIVAEDNLLTWATVSEQNNDYFTLERSRNGLNFEVLGIIAGAGTSTNTLHYNQFDYDPFDGTSYYRLKQTDFDGQYMYSQIIALNRGIQQAVLSDLFPNPANNSVNFELNTPKSGTVNVDMFDNTGRLIATQIYEAHAGSNNFNIDISQFARGVYSTVIQFEHLVNPEIKQLIKQ